MRFIISNDTRLLSPDQRLDSLESGIVSLKEQISRAKDAERYIRRSDYPKAYQAYQDLCRDYLTTDYAVLYAYYALEADTDGFTSFFLKYGPVLSKPGKAYPDNNYHSLGSEINSFESLSASFHQNIPSGLSAFAKKYRAFEKRKSEEEQRQREQKEDLLKKADYELNQKLYEQAFIDYMHLFNSYGKKENNHGFTNLVNAYKAGTDGFTSFFLKYGPILTSSSKERLRSDYHALSTEIAELKKLAYSLSQSLPAELLSFIKKYEAYVVKSDKEAELYKEARDKASSELSQGKYNEAFHDYLDLFNKHGKDEKDQGLSYIVLAFKAGTDGYQSFFFKYGPALTSNSKKRLLSDYHALGEELEGLKKLSVKLNQPLPSEVLDFMKRYNAFEIKRRKEEELYKKTEEKAASELSQGNYKEAFKDYLGLFKDYCSKDSDHGFSDLFNAYKAGTDGFTSFFLKYGPILTSNSKEKLCSDYHLLGEELTELIKFSENWKLQLPEEANGFIEKYKAFEAKKIKEEKQKAAEEALKKRLYQEKKEKAVLQASDDLKKRKYKEAFADYLNLFNEYKDEEKDGGFSYAVLAFKANTDGFTSYFLKYGFIFADEKKEPGDVSDVAKEYEALFNDFSSSRIEKLSRKMPSAAVKSMKAYETEIREYYKSYQDYCNEKQKREQEEKEAERSLKNKYYKKAFASFNALFGKYYKEKGGFVYAMKAFEANTKGFTTYVLNYGQIFVSEKKDVSDPLAVEDEYTALNNYHSQAGTSPLTDKIEKFMDSYHEFYKNKALTSLARSLLSVAEAKEEKELIELAKTDEKTFSLFQTSLSMYEERKEKDAKGSKKTEKENDIDLKVMKKETTAPVSTGVQELKEVSALIEQHPLPEKEIPSLPKGGYVRHHYLISFKPSVFDVFLSLWILAAAALVFVPIYLNLPYYYFFAAGSFLISIVFGIVHGHRIKKAKKNDDISKPSPYATSLYALISWVIGFAGGIYELYRAYQGIGVFEDYNYSLFYQIGMLGLFLLDAGISMKGLTKKGGCFASAMSPFWSLALGFVLFCSMRIPYYQWVYVLSMIGLAFIAYLLDFQVGRQKSADRISRILSFLVFASVSAGISFCFYLDLKNGVKDNIMISDSLFFNVSYFAGMILTYGMLVYEVSYPKMKTRDLFGLEAWGFDFLLNLIFITRFFLSQNWLWIIPASLLSLVCFIINFKKKFFSKKILIMLIVSLVLSCAYFVTYGLLIVKVNDIQGIGYMIAYIAASLGLSYLSSI